LLPFFFNLIYTPAEIMFGFAHEPLDVAHADYGSCDMFDDVLGQGVPLARGGLDLPPAQASGTTKPTRRALRLADTSQAARETMTSATAAPQVPQPCAAWAANAPLEAASTLDSAVRPRRELLRPRRNQAPTHASGPLRYLAEMTSAPAAAATAHSNEFSPFAPTLLSARQLPRTPREATHVGRAATPGHNTCAAGWSHDEGVVASSQRKGGHGKQRNDVSHPRHVTNYAGSALHEFLKMKGCYTEPSAAAVARGALPLGIALKRNGKVAPTGLLLDSYHGGHIYVPDALYPAYLAAMAEDIVAGKRHCISEQRSSPVFRMHFDFDFVGDRRLLTYDQIAHLCRVAQNDMMRFWGCMPSLATAPAMAAPAKAAGQKPGATPAALQDAAREALRACRVSPPVLASLLAADIYISRPKRRRPLHGNEAGALGGAELADDRALLELAARQNKADGGSCRHRRQDEGDDYSDGGAAPDDGLVWKQGVHIVFAGLGVTTEMALYIRESLLVELDRLFGPRPPGCNPWADVVDERVFTHNGLRMPHNYKFDPCHQCDRRGATETGPCQACSREGYTTDGRTYIPAICLTGTGVYDPVRTRLMSQNAHMSLRYGSIRLPAGTPPAPGWRRYLGAPSPDAAAAPGGKTAGAKRKRKDQRRAVDPSDRSDLVATVRGLACSGPTAGVGLTRLPRTDGVTTVAVPEDCPRFARLVRFVRTRMHGSYAHIQGESLTCNRDCTAYRLKVRGRGAHFCLNIGGDHHQSRIYFDVTPDGVFQRCGCSCKTSAGRFTGKHCSEYASPPRQLDRDLAKLLFDSISTPHRKRRRTTRVRQAIERSTSHPADHARRCGDTAASELSSDGYGMLLAGSACGGGVVSPRLSRSTSATDVLSAGGASTLSTPSLRLGDVATPNGRAHHANANASADVAEFFLRLVNTDPAKPLKLVSPLGLAKCLPEARATIDALAALDAPPTPQPASCRRVTAP
jgi:hypothetical protein